MKALIKKAEALQASLEREIEKREEQFENRSEKWQESEKGDEFQTVNQNLQDLLDAVDNFLMEVS